MAERTEALEVANEQLELLSFTDALTGLANRRGFDEKLQTEWARARDAGMSIALAIIDVDEFKMYNDHYGHPAGDACLKRVAAALKRGLRAGKDLAARYGGEEFALILPGTDLEGIYSAAERVRRDIAGFGEEHRASSHGVLTVSIGVVAHVPSNADDRDDCVRAADLGLYEAKRAGRNLVVRVTHDIGSAEAALTNAG